MNARYLAALLLFINLIHAQGMSEEIYQAGFIAIGIGLTIAAIGYMIASVIGTPQALGWAKNEIYENMYSIILISSVMILALAAQVFFITMEHPPNASDYIDVAIANIDAVMTGDIPEGYEVGDASQYPTLPTDRLGLFSIFLRTYAFEAVAGETAYITSINFKPMLDFGEGSASVRSPKISAPMLPGMTKIAEVADQMNQVIFLVILMLMAQKGALIFIKSSGPAIFIVGAFFRALPITRRLGSTLIAIFIALQFVFPAFTAFAYSDQLYGKISKEFSGTYINVDWLSGMPSTTPNYIVFVGPKGIIDLNEKVMNSGVNFSFIGMFPEYNYSVIDENGREICSGTGALGEQVDCAINLNDVRAGDVQDEDSFEESIMFYNISVSFYSGIFSSEDYADYLTSPSLNPLAGAKILVNEIAADELYEFEYKLSVPLLFVKACDSTECEQELMIRDEEFNRIAETYIANQVTDDIDDIYAAGVAGDMLSFSAKVGAAKLPKYLLSRALKEGGEEAAKKTFGALLKSAGKKALGWPAALLQIVTIKSDISTGIFDELACDAYSGTMAKSYFGDPLYKQPEVSSSSADTLYYLEKGYSSASEFTYDTLKEFMQSSFILYSESDYRSCAGSIGLFNKMVGMVLGGVSSGIVDNPREFNVTVLFARVIAVFMITLYSIIITVTFFRSIAENIGGDPSLMGLGKLV